jgi:hypothetical protein
VALFGAKDFKKITPGNRKSNVPAVNTNILYRRNITKLAGGAVIDWDSSHVVKGIEKAIAAVNKRGARRVRRIARGMLRGKSFDSGALYKSISIRRSKYDRDDWIVAAGGKKAPYAMHIEAGWYHITSQAKKARVGKTGGGKWVYAQPYMRPAAASTRKWLKPRMEAAIRRVLR